MSLEVTVLSLIIRQICRHSTSLLRQIKISYGIEVGDLTPLALFVPLESLVGANKVLYNDEYCGTKDVLSMSLEE